MIARNMRFFRQAKKSAHILLPLAGAAAIIALAASGQGQAALAMLASGGFAAALLLASGHLAFSPRDEERGAARAQNVLGALPAALAVSTQRGEVLWRTDAFANALGWRGSERDISELAQQQSEIAASVFRLLNAGRRGRSHAEPIDLSTAIAGHRLVLTVTPWKDGANGESLLIWQAETSEQVAALRFPGAAQNLVDAIPAPALAISKDLTVASANKSFAALFGFSSEMRPNASLFDLIRSQRGKVLTRVHWRDLISRSSGPVRVQVAHPQGGLRPALLHFAGEAGRPSQANAAQLLILTPAQPTAGEPAAVMEAALSQAPLAMAIAARDGVLLSANPAFHTLFGEAAEGAQEPPNGTLFALAGDQPSSTQIRTYLSQLGSRAAPPLKLLDLDVPLKSSSGKRVRLVLSPIEDGSRVMVLALETAAGALLDEQTAQNQKLQAVGELAGGIAHDFNNLLTAIIGFSDLLLTRFRASDSAFKDVMNIKNNATRAAELVRHILAYSRRQTLRPALLMLTDVIEDFHASMGRVLGEKVKAKILHGRDLWFVKADESQVFQVIMNLAVNARDAMPEGGEITIRTANVTERESLALKDRGLERGEYVLCEVRDTGTGINPEHLSKIFDPFFSTKEVGKGTGLGLSTVYGIVKQTGGTILVDSELGAGTAFRIYLPRYVESESDLKARENKPETAEKSADLTGTSRVLLVEDEDAVRSFASRALTTRGYTVLEAASGVEALEVMEREGGRIDLVVSDVVMPEMDGPTLLRRLRERKPDIKVVFMSGYAEEAFRKNLSEDLEFVFLPKPFTLKKLAETVKQAAA